MAELIERYRVDALIHNCGYDLESRSDREQMRKELYEIPTVDAVPARRGHWTPKQETPFILTCSECGGNLVSKMAGLPIPHDFCPMCGADMRGRV